MKKILLCGLFFLGFVFAIYAAYRLSNSTRVKIFLMDSELEERVEEPVLGIYDPHNLFDDNLSNNFRHFGLILNNDEEWEIDPKILEKVPEETPVLLTVEMWDSGILQKVVQGDYDERFRNFFGPLLKNQENLYLRWNPEMDVPSTRYPWEMNPTLYIMAFNRFADIIQSVAPQVKFVWGPAGQPGVLESYPGGKFVYASSITLNSTSEELLENYLQDSLPYQIRRKFHRLRFVDKPIFILGSESLESRDFNMEWITETESFIGENIETIYSEENFNQSEFKSKRTGEILLGFYDPENHFLQEKEVSVEHIFVGFEQIQNGQFRKIFNEAISRDNNLIITVEPGIENHKISDPNVLKNVVKGKYDKIFKKFYSIISSTEKDIYLRFAHEMEIPITRYAWQSKDPVDYIKAFRYFMEFPKKEFKNVKKVWGPAGDRGSLEWYPGNDVVDYVSIAIYGLPDKDITDPEKQETFSRILGRKMYRFRFLDKPFFITEFGVMGDEEFQTKWLINAAKAIKNEPRIIGVNYFNETDIPEVWGDIQPPNWSISRETYKKFVETLYK